MTNLEINRTLHERVMGERWQNVLPQCHCCKGHIPHNGHCWFCQAPIFYETSDRVVITEEGNGANVCSRPNCQTQRQRNVDLYGDPLGYLVAKREGNSPSYTSSWADYGRLLEVAMTKGWWIKFAYEEDTDGVTYANYDFKEETVLNPLRGSTAMAEFVKERGI